METGTRISAIGHGVLIALAVFGLPWFGPREREPIRVTDVSFISEADFEAAQSAAEGPRKPEAPAKPPAPRPAKATEAKQPEPPAPEPPAPEPSAPEPADVAPEVAAVEPPAADEQPAPAEPEAPAKVTPRVITLPETAATPPAPRRT
ncbi:MAG TPA: cell envelope biogenesis protein TolA, partial [Amaricoccus sp.]|nr:cell envelope biogenesis protein TolA [Amaricoccus sp.]